MAMLVVILCFFIVPVIMLIVGMVGRSHPKKEINGTVGYRSKRSKASQEAWDYAQELMAKYILVGTGIDFAIEKTFNSLSVQGSFKKASAVFDDDSRFFRCGASLIVNLSLIRSIDKNEVTFANNSEYTVPRASAKELYKAWLDYWLGNGGA